MGYRNSTDWSFVGFLTFTTVWALVAWLAYGAAEDATKASMTKACQEDGKYEVEHNVIRCRTSRY